MAGGGLRELALFAAPPMASPHGGGGAGGGDLHGDGCRRHVGFEGWGSTTTRWEAATRGAPVQRRMRPASCIRPTARGAATLGA